MTIIEDRIRQRRSRLSEFGLAGHPEDKYWSRTPDLAGVGVLHLAEKRGDRLQVEVRCKNLVIFLDTTNLACVGDLYNLKSIPVGSRIVFSGAVRSITARGIRVGRLLVEPTTIEMDKAVLTPSRDDHELVFGETSVPDPDPDQDSFLLDQTSGGTVAFVPPHDEEM